MSMLVAKGMWLLVRLVASLSKHRPFTYSYQVDIELGLRSFQSTPTNLEAIVQEEDITSSATSASQAGDVVSDDLLVSVQRPELQHTLPTPVEAEASLSPVMVSGGRVDGNELPTIHTETAQSASTAMERQRCHPVAKEYLRPQPDSEA